MTKRTLRNKLFKAGYRGVSNNKFELKAIIFVEFALMGNFSVEDIIDIDFNDEGFNLKIETGNVSILNAQVHYSLSDDRAYMRDWIDFEYNNF